MVVFKCIITLLTGVSVFLISLRMMASGLRKSAGKGIRNLFSKTKNNRFLNWGIGTAATAVIQSSDATSVMVIGFISAGVLTMYQGVCLILGAYVGTTATGILVSLSSLSFSTYFLLFAVVGVIMTFWKKEIVKNLGEFFTGFGLLFFGLATMTGAFKDGSNNPTELLKVFENSFESIKNLAISPLIFFFIGILLTLVTQSSSATSGIVIVLVGSAVIDLPSGFYLVLGATIGSVMPTLLATIGGNVDVKRTGFICAVVKTLPAIICCSLVWIFERGISNLFSSTFGNPQIAVAMFLFSYSLIAMLIQLFFVDQLISLSKKFVADKEYDKKRKALKFIDIRLLNTPKVAVTQAKKEVNNMLNLAFLNYQTGLDEILNQNMSMKNDLIEKEDSIDFINSEITSYLIALSPKANEADEKKIGGYFHMINDIERIGDHAYNFFESASHMIEENLKFSTVAVKEFNEMKAVIDEMFNVVFDIFEDKKNLSELAHLHELEDKTDKLKISMSAAHFARVSDKTCRIEMSSYYSTLVSELERIADHLVNIGYAFVNPTGDEE